MRIAFSRRFAKELEKAPPDVQQALRERLEIFTRERFHPFLNNHALSGRLKNYRSINITGDWRAIFCELGNREKISFERLGTHSQLYKQ